jgi:probable rRNA maturation factor
MKLEGLYTPLRKIITEILSSHKIRRCEISLTFVGENKIKSLNRKYLGRSGITDVISFNLSDEDRTDSDSPLVGDIYICTARARKQAEDLGLPLEEELIRLAAHGVLHLLGYDHENQRDAGRMFELQEKAVGKHYPCAGLLGSGSLSSC